MQAALPQVQNTIKVPQWYSAQEGDATTDCEKTKFMLYEAIRILFLPLSGSITHRVLLIVRLP